MQETLALAAHAAAVASAFSDAGRVQVVLLPLAETLGLTPRFTLELLMTLPDAAGPSPVLRATDAYIILSEVLADAADAAGEEPADHAARLALAATALEDGDYLEQLLERVHLTCFASGAVDLAAALIDEARRAGRSVRA